MSDKTPHIPVLFNEVIDTFSEIKDAFILDCTLGYGGHSQGIIENNGNISLICNDQDDEALNFSKNRLSEYSHRIVFNKGNFSNVLDNFQEKNIAGVKSQFLVLGALEENDKVVLLHPSQPTKNGLKIA